MPGALTVAASFYSVSTAKCVSKRNSMAPMRVTVALFVHCAYAMRRKNYLSNTKRRCGTAARGAARRARGDQWGGAPLPRRAGPPHLEPHAPNGVSRQAVRQRRRLRASAARVAPAGAARRGAGTPRATEKNSAGAVAAAGERHSAHHRQAGGERAAARSVRVGGTRRGIGAK